MISSELKDRIITVKKQREVYRKLKKLLNNLITIEHLIEDYV